MAIKYSDEEINALLQERKPLPNDYRSRVRLRDKRGHKEGELDIQGANGNQFRLILRQSGSNPLDFSIILAICPQERTQLFRLRRYNSRTHEHTNQLERNTFYDFHIHIATERYQEYGTREDAFAEPTDRFSDFNSALRSMFEDCGFDVPQESQQRLFDEV